MTIAAISKRRKTITLSPMFILMLMEDYEARGGELVNEPAYRTKYLQTKRALINVSKTTQSGKHS